jgi:hypothetical protein
MIDPRMAERLPRAAAARQALREQPAEVEGRRADGAAMASATIGTIRELREPARESTPRLC